MPVWLRFSVSAPSHTYGVCVSLKYWVGTRSVPTRLLFAVLPRTLCVPFCLSRGRGGAKTSKAGRMQAFSHSSCHTTTHTEIPDCIYPFAHMHYVTFPHMHSCVMCDYVRRDSVQHAWACTLCFLGVYSNIPSPKKIMKICDARDALSYCSNASQNVWVSEYWLAGANDS